MESRLSITGRRNLVSKYASTPLVYTTGFGSPINLALLPPPLHVHPFSQLTGGSGSMENRNWIINGLGP